MRELLRIFISYSKQDIERVKSIYSRLIQNGFSPWIDEDKLLPGQDWKFEINKNLKSSHVVLVCISEAATNKAGFLHKEIKEALDIADHQPEGTLFLIPLKLEECSIPDRLKLWQWVEIYKDKGFEKLIKALDFRASTLPVSNEKGLTKTQSHRSHRLEGNYIAKGKNNDGTFYQGKVSIKKEGDLYIITWFIGRDIFSSKGVIKEDIFNVFGDFSVSYIIGEDGSLNGIWGESGTEKLIPECYFTDAIY